MDLQKTLEFILEQQAAHSAWLARQDEAIAQMNAECKEMKEAVAQQARNIDKVVTVLEKIIQLQAESTAKLTESMQESSQKLDAVVQITDELIRREPASPRSSL